MDARKTIGRCAVILVTGGWLAMAGCGDEPVSIGDDALGLRTLDQGLVLHWTVEDREGNQILDVSGNGRHGTLLGGGSFVDSTDGEAVQLDGVDDYIVFSGARAPSLYGGPDGAMTLNARVRVSDVAKYNAMCFGCGPLRSVFVGTPNSGSVLAAVRDASTGALAWASSTDALHDDAWVQATIIVEGGVGTRFYLDCALDSEVADTDIALADFGYSAVGQGAQPSSWFGGEIDDLRIWDRALEDEEIEALCPSDPLAEGLQLHWTFEDRSGNQILDQSGNERHGTLQGGGTFVDGQEGDAVSLDGIDDYISFVGPRDPALYGGLEGAFTVSSRVRLDDVGKHNALCYGCGPFRALFVGTAPYGARAMAALFDQGTGGLTWPWSAPALAEDRWTEVTMVVEGGVGTRFYLDCALDSEDLDPEVGLRNYGYSSVGQGGAPGQWYQGDIDELRIWDRALTDEEIATMCPFDPLAEGLEMHWTFEDRVGNTIVDLSGNGRNGTMIGGGFVPSPDGEAASLDGVDDWISFLGPRDLALYGGATGDITISVDARVWDAQRYNTVCFGCGPVGPLFFGATTNGDPWALDNFVTAVVPSGPFNASVASDPVLDPGLWFEVTLVVEGGVGSRIYVNGVLVGERIDPQTQLRDPGSSSMGFGFDGRSFGGEIDQVRVWSRALSDEEASSFGRGDPMLHVGEVMHLDMDNRSGSLLFDTALNGNSALLQGPEIVASPDGEAMRFDGIDDQLELYQPQWLRDPANYGGEDGAFSLTTRLRVPDINTINTLCIGCGPFNSLSVGPLQGGSRAWAPLFNESTSGLLWPTTSSVLSSDQWVQVTLTVDATTGARFYVDCELAGELLDPDIGLRDFGFSSVGRGFNGTWFEGDLSELWTWNRVLTDAEVAALCQ